MRVDGEVCRYPQVSEAKRQKGRAGKGWRATLANHVPSVAASGGRERRNGSSNHAVNESQPYRAATSPLKRLSIFEYIHKHGH